MNTGDSLSHLTLRHTLNKGTACNKKGYGCKGTRKTAIYN